MSTSTPSTQPIKVAKKQLSKSIRGNVRGCTVGQIWPTRMDMNKCGMHRPTMAGIDGRAEEGCFSIVMSGGYDEDEDFGHEIIYTGCGGNDGHERSDQEFTKANASLVVSCKEKHAIRVIRGYKCPSAYAPIEGYRYDGLYQVTEYWMQKINGYNVCRYRLKRIADQDPLVKPRENYNPKKKHVHKSTSSKNIKWMDNLQDGIHLDDALLKSEKGNCVVCGKTIDIDGDESKFYQHVESHITELWNSFTIQEKEILAVRSSINSDRINSCVSELLCDNSNPVPQSTTKFEWP